MKRNYSIDLLRVMSAIAVIVIHVVTAPLNNVTGPVDPSVKSILSALHALSFWAVPVFFMITGYCAALKKECTYKYCFSHVVKFIAVLFTVGLFYALLEEVFTAGTLSLPILLRCLQKVVSGNLWDFMWYVYAIIGIYLVLPLLHSFLQKGPREVFTLAALLFLFTILFPALSRWFSVGIDFPVGGYLFYVVMGGAIAKFPVKRIRLWNLACAGVVMLYCILVFADYSFPLNWNPYLDPFVCIASVGLFFLVTNQTVRSGNTLRVLSGCTWGIYLLHPFFINVVLKVLHLDLVSSMPYVKLPLLGIFIFLCSFAGTYILRQIPLIKKLF